MYVRFCARGFHAHAHACKCILEIPGNNSGATSFALIVQFLFINVLTEQPNGQVQKSTAHSLSTNQELRTF